MTLIEFLLARLDDVAAAASAASAGPWRAWRGRPGTGLPRLDHGCFTGDQRGVAGEPVLIATASWLDAEHIAYWAPDRALAEVEAKRRILDLHRPVRRRSTGSGGGIVEDCQMCDHFPAQYPCVTLRLLALPYANHSDYQPNWRP